MVTTDVWATNRERDCSFDEDGQWFRYRAAAVIMHDGRVLMACNETDPYYYSVGGGVHHGETAEDAVRREVYEETGVRMEIDRLAFIHENFFTDSAASLIGRACHEVTFYFLMEYHPDMELVSGSVTVDGGREWHEWVDLADYGKARPAHPGFFAEELPVLGLTPRWITTRR